VHNSREELTSIDLHCLCSKRLSRMRAVEYRAATADGDEAAVYECARCGKRTIVVHKPNALLFMGCD
jgi:hypothetical protein